MGSDDESQETRTGEDTSGTRIKYVRRGTRSSITKFENQAEHILSSVDPSKAEENVLIKVATIKTTLEGKLRILEEIDEKLLLKCEVSEIEKIIDESTDITARVTEIVNKIDSFIKKAEKAKLPDGAADLANAFTTSSPIRPPHGAGAGIQNVSAASTSQNSGVRLTKITLPRFNGDITRFYSFWQSFESSIDKNESLAQVDKFNYLVNILEGEAFRAIQGLEIIEENYEHAKETLHERFGHKQKIVQVHMESLLNLQYSPNDTVAQLRQIFDNINIHIRGLESLGVKQENYGSLLILVVMKRMPKDVALQVSRETKSDIWEMKNILDIIRKEIEARETCSFVGETEKKATTHRPKQVPGTVSSFHVKEQSNVNRHCYFCEGEHLSYQCDKVVDPNKRKEILSKQKRCFVCLKKGHRANSCNSNRRCRKCNNKHHQSICLKKQESTSEKDEATKSANGSETVTATAKVDSRKQTVLLQTARANVFGEKQENKVMARILLDNGSQRTYITDELKNKLQLTEENTQEINLNTFGSERFKKKKCSQVRFNIDLGDRALSITALTHPVICSPLATPVEYKQYAHLQGLNFADSLDSGSDAIDILLGADYFYEVVTGEIRRGSVGPVAISSKLGWLISGPVDLSSNESNTNSNFVSCCVVDQNLVNENTNRENEPVVREQKAVDSENEIIETLKQFWKTESTGIESSDNQNAENARKEFDITFNGKNYEVSLPWKDDISDPLPSDYDLCHSRLKSVLFRLQKDPQLRQEYDAIIQEQLKSGIIEKVPEGTENKADVKFIPHHCVIRRDHDTTKVRIVFDGSARSSNDVLTLNDRLEVGPNYMPHLFDTLLRFRSHTIALTADIEKAFHQIEIKEADRDFLRFLWYDDVSSDSPSIVQLRMKRLPFGLTPSPAILGETIRKHVSKFKESHPQAVSMLEHLYADDFSGGTNDPEEALKVYKDAKEILDEGGFNLRKWNSNDKEVLSKIRSSEVEKGHLKQNEGKTKVSEEDQSYANSALGPPCSDDKAKILGVNWDSDSDKIYFDVHHVIDFANSLPPTKRSLLKIAAKIFDPLGCLSLFTINLKVMFQQFCLDKRGWDEELSGDERRKYEVFISELAKLQCVSIPRCYFLKGKKVKNVQIHGFSDASECAYAGVVYLRVEYESGEVQVRFVTSKAKVSPIKKQTIPRLELMGAVLLSNLVDTVKKTLQEELGQGSIETHFWVDSVATLCWVKNNKPLKQFVRHRVQKILELSNREEWHFCPGSLNPADLPSRGIYGKHIGTNKVWWEGPNFLVLPFSEWPKLEKNQEIDPAVAAEKVSIEPVHVLVSKQDSVEKTTPLVSIERFSNKTRLLRTYAWILRFVSNLKAAINKQEPKLGPLEGTELRCAENLVIKAVQAECFSKEIEFIASKSKVGSRPPNYVSQFNLFLDDDEILRCRSRINNASISDASKRPILMPRDHNYTNLIILESHEAVFHNGLRETLNHVRTQYWILRGREAVKKVIRPCVICKRAEGLPFASCVLPDLPRFRVDDNAPFSHTGLDFAGPLLVTGKNGDVMKCYVCLYTCLSTRAVHLELVEGLDVESFIRSFRRFCARRGLPATLLSDNAKTFKSASKEVKKLVRSPKIFEYLANRKVNWQFIVALSPWMGGAWERLIRSVKRCLVKTIGRASLSYFELSTILTEVEGVINCRPLTYLYGDADGVEYALTPSHLIYGRNVSEMNDKYSEVVSTYESLSARAKYHHRLLSQFTKQWKSEYLLGLMESYKANADGKKPVINVGDIVILKDVQTKRSFWKFSKIIQLISGADGNVRAARIQLVADNSKRIFTRPLKLLVPLEVSPASQQAAAAPVANAAHKEPVASQASAHAATHAATPEAKPAALSSAPATDRPKRNAAVIGELRRKGIN